MRQPKVRVASSLAALLLLSVSTPSPAQKAMPPVLFRDVNVISMAGSTVEEALRDHKRAGNPIAEWQDGRVVLVPPEQIED